MTTHANKAAQEANWQAFRDSPDWEVLKEDPQHKHTVYDIEKYYLHSTDYSHL